MRILAVALFAAVVTGCAGAPEPPDRKTFTDAWRAAAQHQDGRAAWALVDHPSRERIVAALTRTRDVAAKEPAVAALAAACLAPADPKATPEEQAIALLAAQLVVADGEPTALTLEANAWRTALPAAGFAAGDAPVCLTFELPVGRAAPPAGAAAKVTRAAPEALSADVDPKTVEPVVETVVQEQVDGRTNITILHKAGGKTLDYTRKYADSDDFVKTDLARHELTVRAKDRLTLARTTADNGELAADRYLRIWAVEKDGLRLLQTTSFATRDGALRVIIERPDDEAHELTWVATRKDKTGAPFEQLSLTDRDKAYADLDRWTDEPPFAFEVSAADPARYLAAMTRAAEVANLPPGAAAQATALALVEDGHVGHDRVTGVVVRAELQPALTFTAVLQVVDAGGTAVDQHGPTLVYKTF